VAVLSGAATQVCAGQTTIASKRSRDLYISLMNELGKLAQKDEYCVLFSKTNGGEPIQVEGVFMEFAQQVGKIRETPKRSPLSQDNLGRYCGELDLGKQYYQPAPYYVEVHYTDNLGTRRRCRFFLTLK
jgi:hypothetical protein